MTKPIFNLTITPTAANGRLAESDYSQRIEVAALLRAAAHDLCSAHLAAGDLIRDRKKIGAWKYLP